jgi:membrane protease YdiL (CAAX protease family)
MFPLFCDAEGRLRSGWKVLVFLVALGSAEDLAKAGLEMAPRFAGAAMLISTLLALGLNWAALLLENRPLASIGFRFDSRWARELGLGLLVGGALIGLSALALQALGGFVWEPNPLVNWRSMLAACGFYLLVAVNEEVTYRGYPFQRLIEGLGPWGAQFLFAGFFALVHWSNPGILQAGPALKAVTTLNIALAAILLGLAYLRTRSLALPIGIHWAWNFTQGNLLGFSVSGTGLPVAPLKPVMNARPDWLTGGQVGLEGSLACTFVCASFIALCFFWRGQPAGDPTCPEPS